MDYKFIIAYIGQQKLKGLSDDQIIHITGVENFTPGIVARLQKMFVEGKIRSRPVVATTPTYEIPGDNRKTVTWYDADGRIHRDGDLPAEEIENTMQTWFKHGLRDRETGPAIVYNNGDVTWFKGGRGIVSTDPSIEVSQSEYDANPEAELKKAAERYIKYYATKIQEEFPQADPVYTSEEALNRLREKIYDGDLTVVEDSDIVFENEWVDIEDEQSDVGTNKKAQYKYVEPYIGERRNRSLPKYMLIHDSLKSVGINLKDKVFKFFNVDSDYSVYEAAPPPLGTKCHMLIDAQKQEVFILGNIGISSLRIDGFPEKFDPAKIRKMIDALIESADDNPTSPWYRSKNLIYNKFYGIHSDGKIKELDAANISSDRARGFGYWRKIKKLNTVIFPDDPMSALFYFANAKL